MGGSAEEELGAYGATSGTTTAHTNAARGKRQRGGGGGGKSGGNGGNGASATAGNSGKTGSNWTSALQSAVSSTPTNGSTSDRVVSIPTGICHPTRQQNKYNKNNGANKQMKNGGAGKKSSPSFSFPDDAGDDTIITPYKHSTESNPTLTPLIQL